MNLALWILQALLALAFLAAGIPKLLLPIADIRKRVEWANAVPPRLVRVIGVAETLGAIGLILPTATGILPGLTVVAALGLVVAMLSAVVFHFSRTEFAGSVPSAVLLLLALVLVVGRWKLAII
jgi:uncharacterized membrane protein